MRLILAVVMLVQITSSHAMAQTRAVLELFTSQGCSSCPPADEMMTAWSGNPDLISLSLPVDYWDYMGWKDTLAEHEFAVRQRGYAETRGDRAVYTPQVVVNGTVHAVGSKKDEVEKAIKSAQSQREALAVPVSVLAAGENFTVSVGASKFSGDIWLVPVQSSAKVRIERGENKGKTVTYLNVAKAFRKLASYNGAAASITVKPADFAIHGADCFAVLLQAGNHDNPGIILGAALRKHVEHRSTR